MTIDEIVKEAEGQVPDYFRKLGFKVSWDFSARSGEHWWEIFDDKTIIQIDKGIDLSDILEDLKCIAEGRPTTSKPIYKISCNRGIEGIQQFVKKLNYE